MLSSAKTWSSDFVSNIRLFVSVAGNRIKMSVTHLSTCFHSGCVFIMEMELFMNVVNFVALLTVCCVNGYFTWTIHASFNNKIGFVIKIVNQVLTTNKRQYWFFKCVFNLALFGQEGLALEWNQSAWHSIPIVCIGNTIQRVASEKESRVITPN